MAMIADPSTADCTFTNPRTMFRELGAYDVWDVSFVSWEVNEGVLTPIRIRGFASKPASAGHGIPGIVNVHGLGGAAEPSNALGPAALLGYFAIAVTGPGGGTDDPATRSEGRPASYDDGYRIFDTVTDPRGSWLWGHTVAAMRALTCLATRDEVDPTRLGMTGFSGGAIATLIASSVDERVAAAVPLSGTGAWARSVEASASWFHALLTEAGLDTSSPEWATLLAEIDPLHRVGRASAHVMMVNGTTDEFFPLSSHVDTFLALNLAVERRTSLVGNFDHGCYLLTGGESSDAIAERATWHGEGAQRLWFHHFFGTDPRYARLPAQPTVTVTDAGGFSLVAVVADPGAGGISVERVRFWWSGDSALTFLNVELDAQGGGLYGEVVLIPFDPTEIWFADVEYRTSGIFPERFSLSTVPHLPPGHVPAARGITSCLP